jgi:hypothetical protein
VEDIYLPFKLKRRTKGHDCPRSGLEPLADALFANPTLVPADEAQAYVHSAQTRSAGADFSTVQAVLDGVRDLLSERWAENPALVQDLREWLWTEGLLQSKLMDGKDENNPDVAKFRDYFDYDEPIGTRALAPRSGRVSWPGAGRFWTPSWCSRRRPVGKPSWPKAALPCIWAGATKAGRPTTCCANVWPGPGRSNSA